MLRVIAILYPYFFNGGYFKTKAIPDGPRPTATVEVVQKEAGAFDLVEQVIFLITDCETVGAKGTTLGDGSELKITKNFSFYGRIV